MLFVTRPAGIDRSTKPGPLARFEPLDAYRRSGSHEHNEVKALQKPFAPKTDTSGEDPAARAGGLHRTFNEAQTLLDRTFLTVARLDRQPIKVVGVELRGARSIGERAAQRRDAGSRRAGEVDG